MKLNGQALAVVEVHGLGPSMMILDRLEKTADVRLIQAELNDFYGVCMKVAGDPAALRAAVDAGEALATRMHAQCVSNIIDAPDAEALKGIDSKPEFNPLIQSDVVFIPNRQTSRKETAVSQPQYAIGLIETQGFTAVIAAIDTACKAANVQVVGKEKLGGGYVTIVIKGDVAAVEAAIEAGQKQVDALGKLIAAHVIARPSESIIGLLPNV